MGQDDLSSYFKVNDYICKLWRYLHNPAVKFTHEDMAVPSIIVIFGNIRDTLQVFLTAPTIATVVRYNGSQEWPQGLRYWSPPRDNRQSVSLQTYWVRLQRVDVEFCSAQENPRGWSWWVSVNSRISYPISAFCEQLHILGKFKPNWVVPFWPCAPHSGKGPVVSTIHLPNSIIPDAFRQTQLYLTNSSPTRLCL